MATGELDLSSGVPLYRQIKDILRAEIAGGAADPREPMTEAQLLDRFDVSRAPIRQALKDLAAVHDGQCGGDVTAPSQSPCDDGGIRSPVGRCRSRRVPRARRARG